MSTFNSKIFRGMNSAKVLTITKYNVASDSEKFPTINSVMASTVKSCVLRIYYWVDAMEYMHYNGCIEYLKSK